MSRIEEIRSRLARAAIRGTLTADLDVFDPDDPEIEMVISNEDTSVFFRAGTGVRYDDATKQEREAQWKRAEKHLPVAELLAAAPAYLEYLLSEVERLEWLLAEERREAPHERAQLEAVGRDS